MPTDHPASKAAPKGHHLRTQEILHAQQIDPHPQPPLHLRHIQRFITLIISPETLHPLDNPTKAQETLINGHRHRPRII